MRAALPALFSVLVAPSLFAQCDAKESVSTCWDRLLATQTGQLGVARTVAAANTGVSSAAAANPSALQDFLSVVGATIESASVNNTANAVALDYLLPLARTNQAIRAEAKFVQPTLSKPLSDQLTGKQAGTVKNALRPTDDAAYSATYALMNRWVGRSIALHRTFFEKLRAAQETPMDPQLQLRFIQLLIRLKVDPKMPFEKLKLAPEQWQRVMTETARAATDADKERSSLVAYTRAFTQLLNNQPQTYGTVLRHVRNDSVGAKEWVGSLTTELSMANLDTFRRAHPDCFHADANAKECAAALTQYATAVRAKTDRLALGLEFHDIARVAANLPEYNVSVNTPHGHMIVYSASYGRALPYPPPDRGRIDTRLEYDNASSNPQMHDRLVAGITYTAKLSDTLSIPLSLLYANHEQFLSNVDRKLNLHFGLSLKLPNQKQ